MGYKRIPSQAEDPGFFNVTRKFSPFVENRHAIRPAPLFLLLTPKTQRNAVNWAMSDDMNDETKVVKGMKRLKIKLVQESAIWEVDKRINTWRNANGRAHLSKFFQCRSINAALFKIYLRTLDHVGDDMLIDLTLECEVCQCMSADGHFQSTTSKAKCYDALRSNRFWTYHGGIWHLDGMIYRRRGTKSD